MSGDTGAERLARGFVAAFLRNELDVMRELLADDFVGHVTTHDGSTRTVTADEYVASVAAMDVPSAHLRLDVRDVTPVADDTVLLIVEVHAERHDRTLHNFSGQLVRISGHTIAELWMVDALPAESDRFWAS